MTTQAQPLKNTEPQTLPWKKRVKLKLACWLALAITRLIYMSLRFEVSRRDLRDKAHAMNPTGSTALALWHNNCLAGMLGHAHQNLGVIISSSFDGELIAYCAESFGFTTIRGSSTRGGMQALRGCLKAIKAGRSIAITVDGPKGPLHEVKPGIVDVARKGRIAILPMAAIADRYWTFAKSWDQFRVPKPFSTVRVTYGEPLLVDPELAEYSQALAAVRERLLALET